MEGLAGKIIETLCKDSNYLLPSLFAVFILFFLPRIIKRLKTHPAYIKIALVSAAVCIIAALYNVFVWKERWLYWAAGGTLFAALSASLIVFFSIKYKFRQVIRLSDEQRLQYKENAALLKLKTISPKRMTPKQRSTFLRYQLYILIKLGNLRAADSIMNALKPEDPGQVSLAHYHFIKHVLLTYSGNMEAANEEIQKAEDAINKDTEPIVQVEIALNHGLSYVIKQNYQAADDCFRRAANEYKERRLKDSSLLYLIYYNYAFNKTRMAPKNREYESVIDEYKELINVKNYKDYIHLFNLRLELLRQTGAPRETLNAHVEETLEKVQKSKLPLKNKVIFAGSTARIVWSGRLNPIPCLSILDEHFPLINQLPPMTRYRIMTDLSLLFMDLHGKTVEDYCKLKNAAQAYMLSQAERDLEERRDSLPHEAVLARCDCLKELAGIQRKKDDYDVDKSISFLNSAVALYHENLLLVDENLCRLNIMDELCAPENVDQNYKTKNPSEMRAQWHKVEDFLPNLIKHPALAEFSLRLSFYCLQLDEYRECVKYYHDFELALLSLDNFAPWIHRYRMVTAFSVRIIHFKTALENAKKSREISMLSSEAQAWFKSYPNHDGMMDSMLLGQFIGYDRGVYPIKLKAWFEPQAPSERIHAWLFIKELGLNADITYHQFADETDKEKIFFDLDRHPFESNESWTLSSAARATHLRFQGVLFRGITAADLPESQRKAFHEIYDAICRHVPKNCPKKEELTNLFASVLLPVPSIAKKE